MTVGHSRHRTSNGQAGTLSSDVTLVVLSAFVPAYCLVPTAYWLSRSQLDHFFAQARVFLHEFQIGAFIGTSFGANDSR